MLNISTQLLVVSKLMDGTFLAMARFQDLDFSQEAIKMMLRFIFNVILHLSGFKL